VRARTHKRENIISDVHYVIGHETWDRRHQTSDTEPGK